MGQGSSFKTSQSSTPRNDQVESSNVQDSMAHDSASRDENVFKGCNSASDNVSANVTDAVDGRRKGADRVQALSDDSVLSDNLSKGSTPANRSMESSGFNIVTKNKASRRNDRLSNDTTIAKGSDSISTDTLVKGSDSVSGSTLYRGSDIIPDDTIAIGSDSISEETGIAGKKIASFSHVDIKLKTDRMSPWITGCVFLPSGHALLIDHFNHCVKLLDVSLSLQDSLYFEDGYYPWDLACIDKDNIIVSATQTRKLIYVQVFPTFKKVGEIFIDKWCNGVDVANGRIYAICNDEVQVYTTSGEYLKKLFVDEKKPFRFKHYIAFNKSGTRFYASDQDSKTISCFTVDGRKVFHFKDEGHHDGPWGIYVDSADNVIYSLNKGETIVVKGKGKKKETITTPNKFSNGDYSISVRETDGTLIIGCYMQDTLPVYKLL